MKRSIARKWAKALDSGEYKQTDGALRTSEGFCCLGVLCNIHAQAHPEIAAMQEDYDVYMGEEGSLPEAVMEWVGMASSDGKLRNPIRDEDGDKYSCLMSMNDSGNYTFPQIAKVIRKHWKEL